MMAHWEGQSTISQFWLTAYGALWDESTRSCTVLILHLFINWNALEFQNQFGIFTPAKKVIQNQSLLVWMLEKCISTCIGSAFGWSLQGAENLHLLFMSCHFPEDLCCNFTSTSGRFGMICGLHLTTLKHYLSNWSYTLYWEPCI